MPELNAGCGIATSNAIPSVASSGMPTNQRFVSDELTPRVWLLMQDMVALTQMVAVFITLTRLMASHLRSP